MNNLEITHEMLSDWSASETVFTLIDIREEEERKESHMGGDWIPLSRLAEHIEDLPSTPIVLYCRSGGRSLMATKKLRQLLQREDIFSLAGGMLAKP